MSCLPAIRAGTRLPLIADRHVDFLLAVASLEAGLEGLRINPGNIGPKEHVDRVVDAAKAHGAVIRVGVNSGSVEKRLLQQYGGPCPEALVESALTHVRMLEARGFYDTKISLKSSSVLDTIASYRKLAEACDYPLHIGVTEAGTAFQGIIKSACGLGVLLEEGIGDTLRISLTDDPVEEVRACWTLLAALDLRRRSPELISCPTCGRCQVDLIGLARQVEERIANLDKPPKVAVMGCVVNGPGEAADADIGVASGVGSGVVFSKGNVVRKVEESAIVDALMEEIGKL